MKKFGYLAALLVVVAGAVVLWPAADPLAGVETVAIADPSGGESVQPEIFQGLEFALGRHRIRVVSDSTQADAVVRVEPQSAQVNLDRQGFRATVRCLVTKDGQQYTMDLHVTVDSQGVSAELVQRRFWEVWK